MHPTENDPYLWLEDVASEPALGWVNARNREAETELAAARASVVRLYARWEELEQAKIAAS